MESTREKSARLRAAREARDGTPAERRAETRRVAAIKVAGRADHRLTALLAGMDAALPARDRPEFRRIIRRHFDRTQES